MFNFIKQYIVIISSNDIVLVNLENDISFILNKIIRISLLVRHYMP